MTNMGIPQEEWTTHDPYRSGGHITLARVKENFEQNLREMLPEIQENCIGQSITIENITFHNKDTREKIPMNL